MANPQDYTLVRLDDDIGDNAVLAYDAKTDTIVDSGLTAYLGELQASADTVGVGLQDMSSAGEQVVWQNKHSSVVYAPPWHIIDRVNTEGSRDRIYGTLQLMDVVTDKSGVVENPMNYINVPENGVVFDYTITFPEARNEVEFIIDYLPPDKQDPHRATAWREVLDVSAGENKIELKIPNALYTGNYYFSIKPANSGELPVKVVGNPQTGEFAYSVSYRAFREVPLATKEYVDSAVAGSVGTDLMAVATYDPDKDGSVLLADKLKAADAAQNNQYYGKNATGVLGFHNLPSGNGSSNSTILNEFTVSSKLQGGLFQQGPTYCFIYTGTGPATLTLPAISDFPANQDVLFYVINHSKDKAALTLNVDATNNWNGDPKIGAVVLAYDTGYAIASDTDEGIWYAVSSLDTGAIHAFDIRLTTLNGTVQQHTSVLTSIDTLAKQNKGDIAAHETSIEAHGNQLATHANLIQANARLGNGNKLASQANAQRIESVRKAAVTHITAEVNNTARTITLKLHSESGLVDTVLIDLSAMLGGASQTDHKIYFGFFGDKTLDEQDVLNSGTAKTVPSVSGLDVSITRNVSTSAYIWIWLPDSAGTVRGFTFSGFLSKWPSTALSVAGVLGKLYVSPNTTSAKNVDFEVTV